MRFDNADIKKFFDMSLEDLNDIKNGYKAKMDLCDEVIKLRKKNGEKMTSKSNEKNKSDNPYQQ